MHIIIDPGHGGSDNGAIHNGIREATLTLAIARELEKLVQTNSSLTYKMTRESDSDISLDKRVALAEQNNAQILISIHANSAPTNKAKGAQFYFQNQLSADEESLYLAHLEKQFEKQFEAQTLNPSSALQFSTQKLEQSLEQQEETPKRSELYSIIEDLKRQTRIQKSFDLSLSIKNHWPQSELSKPSPIRQAPFYLFHNSKIPTVLVEVGFLTHQTDAQKLTNKSFHQKIAQSIYNGIIHYKEKIDKPTHYPLK